MGRQKIDEYPNLRRKLLAARIYGVEPDGLLFIRFKDRRQRSGRDFRRTGKFGKPGDAQSGDRKRLFGIGIVAHHLRRDPNGDTFAVAVEKFPRAGNSPSRKIDQHMISQFLWWPRRPASRKIFWRSNRDAARRREFPRYKSAVIQNTGTHNDIKTFRCDIHHALTCFDLHPQVRISVQKTGQPLVEAGARERLRHADPQATDGELTVSRTLLSARLASSTI